MIMFRPLVNALTSVHPLRVNWSGVPARVCRSDAPDAEFVFHGSQVGSECISFLVLSGRGSLAWDSGTRGHWRTTYSAVSSDTAGVTDSAIPVPEREEEP